MERFEAVTNEYKANYKKYGYSEQALFMPSDRRNIRYYELIKNFEFYKKGELNSEFSILDAGCGFGDVNGYLKSIGAYNYTYFGLDVIDEFLKEGSKRYRDYGKRISYIKRNLRNDSIDDLVYDYAISSQAFTLDYNNDNEIYDYMFCCVKKLFENCRKGIAFNFYTDKGEYFKQGMAYHNPGKVLEFAYTLSKNVILDNGCFPYECTVTILKNENTKSNMLFESFVEIHKKEFDEGLFVIKEK